MDTPFHSFFLQTHRAPPWAPICLWYCFLVQIFCTSGKLRHSLDKNCDDEMYQAEKSVQMIKISRVIVPLMFLAEGVSYHSFLLDLTGGELLTLAYLLSAIRCAEILNIIFVLTLSIQILISIFFGEWWSHFVQLEIGLLSLQLIQTSMSVRRKEYKALKVRFQQSWARAMMSEKMSSNDMPPSILGGVQKMKVNDMQKKFITSVLTTGKNVVKRNDKKNKIW